jgi:signal transduction histidine kinase
MARRTAAEAMREMRHLLDVLREGEASYLPQPGIQRLGDLVRDAGDAGLRVDLTVTGDVDGVPDGPSLAAYRLVQESLTNVLKHAPGAHVAVRVAATAAELTVEVRDDGGSAAARPRPEPGGDLAGGGGGHGLPGMRERVRVYGGSLTAGPEGAGWAVRAVLPLGAA